MADQPSRIPERPELVDRYWQKFIDANGTQADRHSFEALQWFQRRVSKDMKVQAKSIIKAQTMYKRATRAQRNFIGKMFLFEYEAQEAGHAETGMYDRFPMVFFFNVVQTQQGHTLLYGLNIHYLTPKERMLFFRALMKLKVTKKWTPDAKLRLTWELIKQVANTKMAEKAVHAYRVDRLKSWFTQIPSEDWQIAAFLRVERWVAAPNRESLSLSDARRMVTRN
ncbi:gp2 DNA end protector protein [Delftia phage PhiW-14]|uniref:Gp2 DNA end protector protein n=1 Tax=Delftia phage PhiW-14 TaxID=665032 RepID=C9DFY6_BPW14|nr:DNA end protector [Delftia phage PhiW-14]ACV50037.1 gp2 DNA end protector protein [Delftia phage PhiW-14]